MMLNRGWRIFGTAISFASFGLGGMILGLIVFPLMILFIRSTVRRQFYARMIVSWCFRLFLSMMKWLGVITYSIENSTRLKRKGLLVVANHPTLIDVVFLVAFTPNADCVVKKTLFYNPFTWGVVRAAGYICNDSGEQVVQNSILSIKNGGNLIIFPEGTRTTIGQDSIFQRGAANIAVRGHFFLTPIHIKCEPPTLKKGDFWYNAPEKKPHFSLWVDSDIMWSDLPFGVEDLSVAKKVRLLTDFLQQYFRSGERYGKS